MPDDASERFRSLVTNIGLAHQHLGVIRTFALRRTHLLGQHDAYDANLLAELTLYGKFYELPERRFFRRFHQTSGSWKRGDREHEAKRYYGASSKRYFLKTWRSYRAFAVAVRSAPIPFRSKVTLNAFLLRRAFWSRSDLSMELVDYLRFAFRSAPK